MCYRPLATLLSVECERERARQYTKKRCVRTNIDPCNAGAIAPALRYTLAEHKVQHSHSQTRCCAKTALRDE